MYSSEPTGAPRVERGRFNENLAGRIVLSLVFLWGGIIKTISPDAFGVVVWRVLGESIPAVLAVGFGIILAALEILVGIALLLNTRQRLWVQAVLGMLFIYTLVFVRLLVMPDAPSCGCLTAPGLRAHPMEFWLGLVRNAALIWVAWIVWRGLEKSP